MGFLAKLPAGLLSSLGGAFAKALFESLFGFLEQRKDNQTREQLGAARVIAALNKENADAERRAASVAETRPDDVADRLAGGLFGR